MNRFIREALISTVTLIISIIIFIFTPNIVYATQRATSTDVRSAFGGHIYDGVLNMQSDNSHDGVSYGGGLAGVSAMPFNIRVETYPRIAPISREKARDYLLDAVKRYSGALRPEDILKGSPNEGPEHLLRPATRVEAVVMISRAFGRLPSPVGDLNRSGAPAPQYTDIPDWAENDVDNLSQARILLPSDSLLLNSNEILDESEFYRMIHRIYALLAYAPQDDFYRTINRDWLENSELRKGESSSSIFDDLEYEIELKIDSILNSILKRIWHKGTKEQKISDLYNTIINMDSRNNAGSDPIKPYLEAIAQANNQYALDKALYAISRDLGIDLFFSFSLEPDIYKNSKYAVYLACPAPTLPKSLALDYKSPQMEALAQYAAELFAIAGYKNPEASAEAVRNIEWQLAKSQRDPSLSVNYADDYKKYSISKLKKLFPAADIVTLGALSGLKPEEAYYITDARLFAAFSNLCDEDNLEAVKAYAAFRFLDICSDMLSQDYLDARHKYFGVINATPETPDPDREAKAKLLSLTSEYFSEMYVEKYISLAIKRDVEAMGRIMTDTLKTRIDGLQWMSEETKEAAKRKLDAVNIKIGMPENWDSVMDSVSIRGTAEGGTCFENITAYYRQCRSLIGIRQGKTVNKDEWDICVLTANAYYKTITNEIIIPAAMLQSPLYVYRGKKEINYAGIGCIIAHELIHAIDYHGAQFDEHGNVAFWWTDEEKVKFAEICAIVASHYDGYEAAPGLTNNSTMTIIENIADLGMITCALDVIEAMPDPDYRLFFTKAAGIWASTATRDNLEMFLRTDIHSTGNVRVNKSFQNFEQFYETFNIKQSDGMYIPPENRLNIW